jgi:hypothetical protein
MMNDLPREQLKYIIGQYGRSIAEDPKRCEALLRDFCGQYRKEINVLVSAIKESVPADLSSSKNRVPSTLLLAQLTKRLEDYLAIDREAARWAVESWAIALGLISEGARNVVVQSKVIPDGSIDLGLIPERNVSVVDPERKVIPDGSVIIDPIVSLNSNIRLFTQNQVRLATFFGGLLGGSILMTLNYKRTGQKAQAKECLVIGLIPNIIIDFLIFSYSPNIAGQFCGITLLPSIYFMHKWYEKSQNTLLKQHLSNGGKKGSWWSVLGTTIFAGILIYPWFNLPILVVTIIGGDKF